VLTTNALRDESSPRSCLKDCEGCAAAGILFATPQRESQEKQIVEEFAARFAKEVATKFG